MLKKLDEIKQQAIEELGNITDKADLEALRVAKLGKKGVITGILKQMGSLSAEERPLIGAKANEVRTAIEAMIASAGERIKARETERRLAATEDNMTRINDVFAEVSAQVVPTTYFLTCKSNF